MGKLLRIEFKNLFSGRLIKIALLIFFILGFTTGIINKIRSGDPYEYTFKLALVIIPIVAVFGGSHISKDYIKHTIKNKIIVGHTRFNIYMSKQIAVSFLFLISITLFIGSAIISNLIFIGGIDGDSLLKNLLILFLIVINLSIITVFISMSIKKEIGGIIPMFVVFIMTTMSYLLSKIEGIFGNIINIIIPTSNIMILKSESNLNMIISISYLVILSIFFLFYGLRLFEKSDIK